MVLVLGFTDLVVAGLLWLDLIGFRGLDQSYVQLWLVPLQCLYLDGTPGQRISFWWPAVVFSPVPTSGCCCVAIAPRTNSIATCPTAPRPRLQTAWSRSRPAVGPAGEGLLDPLPVFQVGGKAGRLRMHGVQALLGKAVQQRAHGGLATVEVGRTRGRWSGARRKGLQRRMIA